MQISGVTVTKGEKPGEFIATTDGLRLLIQNGKHEFNEETGEWVLTGEADMNMVESVPRRKVYCGHAYFCR